MHTKTEGREILKQKGIRESGSNEYSFIGLEDQSELEIKWIKLHQMFDK